MDRSMYVIAFLLQFWIYGSQLESKHAANMNVVLLLYDGFRWDFIERHGLPHFRQLAREGASVKGLKSAFVAESLPNFATLVTGLYPQHHGLTADNMYDPVLNETFDDHFNDGRWFSHFNPIWTDDGLDGRGNTSRRDDKHMNHQKLYADFLLGFKWLPHKQKVSFRRRLSKIVDMLKSPNSPRLIVSHFRQPATIGLRYGPDSRRVRNKLRKIDKCLGKFIQKLKTSGLYNKVNILIAGTHGLASVQRNHIISVKNIVNKSMYHVPEINNVLNIWPKPGFNKAMYDALKSAPHVRSYYKLEVPHRFHYHANRRIAPIIALADHGWRFSTGDASHKRMKGGNGYDNDDHDMDTIFIARGPSFKSGAFTETLENVHVYPILCHLLGVKPHPNNGSLNVTQFMLTHKISQNVKYSRPMVISTTVITLLCIILFFLAATAAYVFCRKPRFKYVKLQQNEFPLQFAKGD